MLLMTVVLGLLSACAAETTPDPTAVNTPAPGGPGTTPEPSPSGSTQAVQPSTSKADPTSNPAANSPISKPDSAQLMEMLVEDRGAAVQDALEQVVQAADESFIPVFIELLRASDIGLVNPIYHWEYIQALEELSGQRFGDNWAAWVEWYGRTEIQPPPGFTGWKGRLLGRIDPGFADLLRDEFPNRLRVEEIMWGGVPLDGIPALDNPSMIPAGEADYLLPGEPVFGLSINGEARAYPLRILDWHEMANDVVGGVPVSLAYCTLCGAGIAYDGRLDGAAGLEAGQFTFGSSGFLYRSNKLMYDRQTRTLWNQLTGEPVLGPLADADIRLEILPLVRTSWEDWLAQHPGTLVLDIETGFQRPYEIGAAYADYFASTGTMFPVWQRSGLLPDKARIYALKVDGAPKAYPVDLLVQEGVVNDSLNGTPVVLVAQRENIEVEGRSYRSGPAAPLLTYGSGAEVRAYLRGGETFSPGPDPSIVMDGSGNAWQVTEEALRGPNGESLERLPGHLAYWFGWYAFFPNTELYEVPE